MQFRGAFVSCAAVCAAAPAAAQSDTPAVGLTTSWLAMVEHSQAEQPRWITPLATVTPRLEQEFRFDVFSEALTNHSHLENYGAAKGLEFIPTENTEIIIGVPPYDVRTSNTGNALAEGWGDWPAFLIKYRFLTATEQAGNYVVSGFFQFGVPSGNAAFTNHFYILQPTIAFGKGWGDFDVQATISEQFAAAGARAAERNFGSPVLVNVAAQYHLFDVLWPEVELNSTWWPGGAKEGKIQSFLTPGIILGRFEIHDRVRLIFGAGYQMALSPRAPSFRDNLIVTLRTTF